MTDHLFLQRESLLSARRRFTPAALADSENELRERRSPQRRGRILARQLRERSTHPRCTPDNRCCARRDLCSTGQASSDVPNLGDSRLLALHPIPPVHLERLSTLTRSRHTHRCRHRCSRTDRAVADIYGHCCRTAAQPPSGLGGTSAVPAEPFARPNRATSSRVEHVSVQRRNLRRPSRGVALRKGRNHASGR